MCPLLIPVCLSTLFLVPAAMAEEARTGAAAGPAGVAEIHHGVLVSGLYSGQWGDGRTMVETVQMVTPDMITLQRHVYSSSPVTFRRVEAGLFRDRQGNTLTLLSATRIRWTDSGGRHSVTFDRTD
jgi:hypothetical protein